MKEDYHKWYSPTLSKDIEMLVFGHAGYPVILFPTTSGRYYECKDFKLIESAQWFLDQGLVQIYCPDSINELSWYNKNIHPAERVKNHIWYDKFIMDEVVNSKKAFRRLQLLVQVLEAIKQPILHLNIQKK